MNRAIKRNDFAVMPGTDSPNYLGNPAVVTELVNDFVAQVYAWTKARGNDTMTVDEMTAKLEKITHEKGDIIMGRNPDYVGIMGWNNPYALGLAIKQCLGEYWELRKGDYNDPGKTLFTWLAATLVGAALDSMNDPDLAGAKFNAQKAQVIKLIMGLHARR